jgi:hypothetical protein
MKIIKICHILNGTMELFKMKCSNDTQIQTHFKNMKSANVYSKDIY